ncbi:MAG: hypothetical protein AAFN41_07245 [Planctomycetota bacterium]
MAAIAGWFFWHWVTTFGMSRSSPGGAGTFLWGILFLVLALLQAFPVKMFNRRK